jgi:hypothetical protein
MKWQPRDVIASIIVVGALTLLVIGRDTWVAGTLLAVTCAYYGIELTPFIHLGRNQHKKEREENKNNG